MKPEDLTPEIVLKNIRGKKYSRTDRREVLDLLLDGIVAGQVNFDISKIAYVRGQKTQNLLSLAQTYLSTDRFVKTYELMKKFQPEYNIWRALWDSVHNGQSISMNPLKKAVINQNIDLFEEILKIMMNTEIPESIKKLGKYESRLDLDDLIMNEVENPELRNKFMNALKNRGDFKIENRKRKEREAECSTNLAKMSIDFICHPNIGLQSAQDEISDKEDQMPLAKRQKTAESQEAEHLKPIINYSDPRIISSTINAYSDSRNTHEISM
jgi:hypothetical protein